jgi:cell division protein FtsL
MNRIFKILISILLIALVLQVYFLYHQNSKIRALENSIEELGNQISPENDLSDIESRLEDLETDSETIKRSILSPSTHYDVEYEIRKLSRRIDDLENRIRF